MCGITGFIGPVGMGRDERARILAGMSASLRHRGPDSGGQWIDEASGVALGHRRLAIVDLTAEGHQPMVSSCGRYTLTFNGEIYNHGEVRDELRSLGAVFRGRSDTEVMAEGFGRWGVSATLPRLAGMFAFAVYDREKRELVLARDRLGEKPLYYGAHGGVFLFASELKSIQSYPGLSLEIDRGALALFMRHNYVPSPYSIYKGFYKLPAGTCLRIKAGAPPSALPPPEPYWSLASAMESGRRNPFQGGDDEAIEALEEKLSVSVGQMMMADVPLGAFLSGGIDSSLITAVMQKLSAKPVKTFTIGFEEKEFDEARHAAAVARHLGTEHTELRVTPKEALETIPSLPLIYDEPFSDSSQIPTCLVSALTRRKVTVCLSGDGGDEIFAGYTRYLASLRLRKIFGTVPGPLRRAGASLMLSPSHRSWEKILGVTQQLLPGSLRQSHPSEKIIKLLELLKCRSVDDIYQSLVSQWKNPCELVLGARELPTLVNDQSLWPRCEDPVDLMMYLDAMTYLPGDIMAKVDRATMAVSLESRAPYLDHRLVEFAHTLPMRMKLRNGRGKWLMRRVLEKHVPAAMFERPKIGFGVPIGIWMKGPLRDWAESLLDPRRIRREGFLDERIVSRHWQEHLSGARDRQHHLWAVLMFQAWLEKHPSGGIAGESFARHAAAVPSF
jgi:asparagine synthase (glutamine-hydrolysing)